MKVGDATQELWLSPDGTWDGEQYVVEVTSFYTRGQHTYSWAVDFYADDKDDTEPVPVDDGKADTFKKACHLARRAADEHALERRRALARGRRKRARSGWSL